MNTHITYKTAKALKEFLGESAPLPMTRMYWAKLEAKPGLFEKSLEHLGVESFPAYQLHDLLSKPFCEAFIKERFARGLNYEAAAWELTGYLERMINGYYKGGLPAVEAALTEMMEAK